MSIINVFFFFCVIFLLARIYFLFQIEKKSNKKTSLLGRFLFRVFFGGLIFPVLKSMNNKEQDEAKRKANTVLGIFWFFFLLIILTVLI